MMLDLRNAGNKFQAIHIYELSENIKQRMVL